MTLGQRIGERAKALGISQSLLARRVGVGQTTINGLIRGSARWSPYLTKIARELGTTVEYLVGDADDPDEGATPVPPAPAPRLFLEVALPSVDALAVMFEALLDGLDRGAPHSEQALLLAERLSIGLSQLVDARPAPLPKVRRSLAPDEALSSEPMPDRGHRS